MQTFCLLVVTGLGVGALYFLLASGLSLIFGLMRILSFAHGAMLALGGYAGWLVLRSTDGQPSIPLVVLSVLAAGLVSAIASALLEILLLRPLFGRELEQVLLTVGVGIATIGLLQGYWGPNERTVPMREWLASSSSIAGVRIPNDRFILIAAAILVFVGLQLFLRHTRYGLIIRAGVENREMVQALGINVRVAFTLVFAFGGMAAGAAGAFQSMYLRAVSPSMGNDVLIFSFIVLIIGGLGSIRGALVASACAGVIQALVNYYVAVGAGDVLIVALLAVTLLVRPEGLFGVRERLT